MLEDLLAAVDPAAKRALGAYFLQIARLLGAQAELAEEADRANARRRARNAEARRAARAIDARVLQGEDPETAIAALAARLEIDPAQLRAWWHAGRSSARIRRRLRDIEMMRLVAKGWRNAELAQRFKVSEATIARTIRRLARQGHAARVAPAGVAPPCVNPAAPDDNAAKNAAGESLSPAGTMAPKIRRTG